MTSTTRSRRFPKTASQSVGWVLVLAALFTIPVLTIDFFHTEDDGFANDNCPACQLKKSATATGAATAPELPAPVSRIIQKDAAHTGVEIFLGVSAASRSPPSA